MVKTAFLYIILIISTASLLCADDSIAVIKSFDGIIKIEKDGQSIPPRVYLALTPGTTIRVTKSAYITLFLYTGEKKTFSDEGYLQITQTGIKGLDSATNEYLALAEDKTVYSRKDTLSSRGFDPELTDEIKKEITRIEAEISDPLLRALLKGDIYKKYSLKKLARKEFLKHKKLLEELADQED